MEEVKDLILYQVATDRNYRVGDKIIFDKNTINGQYKRVYTSLFQKDEKKISDFVYYYAKKRFTKLKRNDLYEIAHALDFYDLTLRELALEDVRKEFYPDYPSRLHCMYLSNNKDIALNNMKSMMESNEKQGSLFQVITVKLDGRIFKAGNFLLSREGQSYDFYKENAKYYWSQNNVKDEDIKEILFEGTAEIIEIIDEKLIK